MLRGVNSGQPAATMSEMTSAHFPVRCGDACVAGCGLPGYCLRSAAIVLLLLSGSQFLPAQRQRASPMPATDQDALTRAVSFYEQGRMQDAEPALINILSRYPQNGLANETLGLIYAQQGAVDRALPYLTRAAEAPSSTAADHANLGAALLKLGRAPAALPELQTASRLDPLNADTASELGQAYMLNHDPVRASRAFAAAAKISPPDADLLYNWALALSETGATQQAASMLARIPSAKMSAEADSLAGDMEEKLGQYMAAVKYYQNAATKDPSEANLYALTIEFLRHWTWDDAQKVAEFGRARYPESARMEVALGIACYGSGQFPRAVRIFSGLLDKDPENASYADLMGRTCSNMNEEESAACARMIAFAKRHPKNALAAVYAAESILHQPAGEQDMGSAESLLKGAIAADPALPEAYYQMGILDQQRLQWQASAAILEKAVALRPSFASAHYRLARAYARLGKSERAKEEIALQQKYRQQETERLDASLKNVSIFLPSPQ
jgi:tetratricopeptide (TPR) repeat protein